MNEHNTFDDGSESTGAPPRGGEGVVREGFFPAGPGPSDPGRSGHTAPSSTLRNAHRGTQGAVQKEGYPVGPGRLRGEVNFLSVNVLCATGKSEGSPSPRC